MYYGELRLQLKKWDPEVDLDVLDAAINGRARMIWERRNWKGRQRTTVLTLPGAYQTGTVAIAQGSTAVTGTGTVWTAAMTGMRIRLAGSNEWYVLTQATATTGTLDRAFAEATVTAQGYAIYQPIAVLPSTLSALKSLDRLTPPLPLNKRSGDWLNGNYPHRPGLGPPEIFSEYPDSEYKAEVFPAPQVATSLYATYFATFVPFVATSTPIPEWLSWAAIERGVRADLAARNKNYAGQDAWEKQFRAAVETMERDEDRRTPVKRLRLSPALLPPRSRYGATTRRVW